jgi:hypothetical protein
MAMKEMRRVGLLDALDYCVLLASEAPKLYDAAARKWLGLLLAECGSLTLDDVQLALACLRSLAAGDFDELTCDDQPIVYCEACWEREFGESGVASAG